MTTQFDYEKQAQDFLDKYKIKMTINKIKEEFSPFGKGKCDKYIIVLTRTNTKGKELLFSFPFWGSINDHENNKTVTPYDVISCGLSGDWHYYTQKDYYMEFGYLPNNIDDVLFHAKQIRKFFAPTMRAKLDEIN